MNGPCKPRAAIATFTCRIAVLILVASLQSATALSAEAGRAKRILMLFSESKFLPGNALVEQAAKNVLEQGGQPLEFYAEYLDAGRFPGENHYRLFREYLQEKYGQEPPDLVLAFLTRQFELAGQLPAELFPKASVVFGALTEDKIPRERLGTNVTGVVVRTDFEGALRLILKIQPETQRIVVVGGTAPMDRFYLGRTEEAAQSLKERVHFEFWAARPMAEIREAVASLPSKTVILFTTLFRDASGATFLPEQALSSIAASSRVPVYVLIEPMIGGGAVGGIVAPIEAGARRVGELALRVLAGTAPASLGIEIYKEGVPIFDWRALKRWGISESRLPPGSLVRFREPTMWERYKSQILGAIGIFVFQTLLIMILLTERRRRRRTQENLDERLRFEELVSQLSARFISLPSDQIDKQIVDSLREVARFLGFDFSTLSIFTGPAVGRVAFIWQAPGTPRMPSNLTEKDFPWLARELFAGRDVSFLAPSELPPEAEIDRATVEKIQNQSVHCVPLLAGETPVGVLNVGTFFRKQGIAADLLRRLRLLGEIFANALGRKRADESLRQSEERFGLAAQSANLGVWSWDIPNDSVWATEKCRALYGVSLEQKISFQTFLDTLHDDDRERVTRSVESALRAGREFAEEYRVVLPDRTVRWIGAFGRGSNNGSGEPVHMLGVSIDITERKRAEERFRLAVEASPNAIVMVNGEGKILLVNRLTEKLFGYARDELIGQSVEMLVPERFRALHPEHRAEFFAAPQTRAMGAGRDLFARRKEGSEFQVEIGLNPIQTSEGTLVLTAIVDITQRKRAEAEVQRNREELAHVTRITTMGELAASLAHELNQPLTAILSNAQAAQRFLAATPADLAEVREILQDIVEDNNRAGEVIRRLRALVKKEDLLFESLDLASVTSDVILLVRSDAILRNVEVSLKCEVGLPKVRGDKVQLQQVLLNLLLNAFDAMKECSIEERQVLVTICSDGTQLVEVAVQDRGTGLTSDKLDKIFQPFFTTKRDGLGMGLSISRSIVEAHGGRLWAENNATGRGAQFHMVLPMFAGA